MQSYATATSPRTSTQLRPNKGILVLSGYGVRVSVQRRHLCVSDCLMGERRHARFARATARLTRVVVLGHSGTITLESLRWLADVGVAFVQIDADGNVVACFAPQQLDDPWLRRAQALARFADAGLAIARDLTHLKLQGQLGVLLRLQDTGDAATVVARALDGLSDAKSVDELRLLEAAAAAGYWDAWSSMPVRFARRDVPKVPDHWKTFGSRTSPFTASPRKAANPANAILNYLYAILESETRIAALTLGLDPGMGVAHVDQRARDSLALDLMEPVRPMVDEHVLELLDQRTFSAREFLETPTGWCRLVPPLPQLLAKTASHWRALVAPIAEGVAENLARAQMPIPEVRVQPRRMALPTLLTQRRRSAGRDAVRRQPKRMKASSVPALPHVCRSCGNPLSDRDRLYCESCFPERRAEVVSTFSASGPQALVRLRGESRDPAHGAEAARKRGTNNARRQREVAEWNQAHGEGSDPETFRREILPGLRDVPLSAMSHKTGLTRSYCWMIRQGRYVPHQRHWEHFRKLGSGGQC